MAMTIGQIIRTLRKERNLTQEELAEQLNITAQAVSRWENETGLPDISQVVPLANVFGVSVDVLFGTNGVNGEQEVEGFIREMERKRFDRMKNGNDDSEHAFWLDRCQRTQEMLKTYPNNYALLTFSVWSMVYLLWACKDERSDSKTAEMKMWRDECIRQANVILHHCTDATYLNEANRGLVSVYRIMGDYHSAEHHAKKLPEFHSNFERGGQLAIVYEDMGRTEDAMRQFGNNIGRAMHHVEHELSALGYLYLKQKKYEEAYACYRFSLDIHERMVSEQKEEFPHFSKPCYNWCAAACIHLERYDEAMDWLEKGMDHANAIAGDRATVVQSNLPYCCGVDLDSVTGSLSGKEIAASLEWDCFDPIRSFERFQKIMADAEAMKRGI